MAMERSEHSFLLFLIGKLLDPAVAFDPGRSGEMRRVVEAQVAN